MESAALDDDNQQLSATKILSAGACMCVEIDRDVPEREERLEFYNKCPSCRPGRRNIRGEGVFKRIWNGIRRAGRGFKSVARGIRNKFRRTTPDD
uniref:Uncharacterized protein n=1 Tax=Romanomermis culicivorax TaxID=13658 RepID=A0A915IK30_ROMCU